MNENDLSNKITESGKALELRTVRVLEFLNYISKKDGVDSKSLLRKFGFSESLYKNLLKHFRDYLMPHPGLIRLKESAQMREYTDLRIQNMRSVDKIEILDVLDKYRALRPDPNRKYDQFTATNQTTAKRVVEMAKNGDLFKRRIAFLGDDDLNSVAVAETKKAKKITVFEIDQRIIDTIKKIAEEQDLDIEVVKHDVRSNLPKNYLGSYDTVFTDPPYTEAGVSLFLNRGVELLTKRFTSRIYFCYGNSDRARERELEIQKLIFEKGLLVNSKKFQFNKYYGAESIGSSSSLYLLDWTPKTNTTKVNTERLYTNE